MRLGLSSAAAPDASLEELLDACRRRGLAALELREGDAHGVVPGDVALLRAASERAVAAGVGIAGYRTDGAAGDAELAALSRSLGAPVLLAGPAAAARAARIAGLGARAAVVLGDPAGGEGQELPDGVEAAWDADPAAGGLGERAAALLGRLRPRLAIVRLAGGGPEALGQAGQGIGELMGQLALAGYGGAVVLTPTSSRYRVAWQTWLRRGGGWGCGSKATSLPLLTVTPGGDT
ncbi:MAG: hypothetical protein IT201_09105 [Thermoleophilia bacterium]|nr:hypothetical protein [Thermoleophilia bacterium]